MTLRLTTFLHQSLLVSLLEYSGRDISGAFPPTVLSRRRGALLSQIDQSKSWLWQHWVWGYLAQNRWSPVSLLDLSGHAPLSYIWVACMAMYYFVSVLFWHHEPLPLGTTSRSGSKLTVGLEWEWHTTVLLFWGQADNSQDNSTMFRKLKLLYLLSSRYIFPFSFLLHFRISLKMSPVVRHEKGRHLSGHYHLVPGHQSQFTGKVSWGMTSWLSRFQLCDNSCRTHCYKKLYLLFGYVAR